MKNMTPVYVLDTSIWKGQGWDFFDGLTGLTLAACELSVLELGAGLDKEKSRQCQSGLQKIVKYAKRYFPDPDVAIRRCVRLKARPHSYQWGGRKLLNLLAKSEWKDRCREAKEAIEYCRRRRAQVAKQFSELTEEVRTNPAAMDRLKQPTSPTDMAIIVLERAFNGTGISHNSGQYKRALKNFKIVCPAYDIYMAEVRKVGSVPKSSTGDNWANDVHFFFYLHMPNRIFVTCDTPWYEVSNRGFHGRVISPDDLKKAARKRRTDQC